MLKGQLKEYTNALNNANFLDIPQLQEAAAQQLATYIREHESLFSQNIETMITLKKLHSDMQRDVSKLLLYPVTLANTIMTDFCPNGAILASGSSDDTIKLWDPTTPTLLKTVGTTHGGHTDAVRALAFNPNVL